MSTTQIATPQAQANKHRATMRTFTSLTEAVGRAVTAFEDARFNGGEPGSDIPALEEVRTLLSTLAGKYQSEAKARWIGGDPEGLDAILDMITVTAAVIEDPRQWTSEDEAPGLSDKFYAFYSTMADRVGDMAWRHDHEWTFRNVSATTRALVAQNID